MGQRLGPRPGRSPPRRASGRPARDPTWRRARRRPPRARPSCSACTRSCRGRAPSDVRAILVDVARSRRCPASGRARRPASARAMPASTASGRAWSWMASNAVIKSKASLVIELRDVPQLEVDVPEAALRGLGLARRDALGREVVAREAAVGKAGGHQVERPAASAAHVEHVDAALERFARAPARRAGSRRSGTATTDWSLSSAITAWKRSYARVGNAAAPLEARDDSSSTLPSTGIHWQVAARLFGRAFRVREAACSGREHVDVPRPRRARRCRPSTIAPSHSRT